MVKDGSRWCKMVQDSATPCNIMQYHAIPCNTMQYHASLITADGAYHCPVGSIVAIFVKKFTSISSVSCFSTSKISSTLLSALHWSHLVIKKHKLFWHHGIINKHSLDRAFKTPIIQSSAPSHPITNPYGAAISRGRRHLRTPPQEHECEDSSAPSSVGEAHLQTWRS